ncbi:MAG: hypothetical protein PHU63_04340, partial [Candidatus ainarchaeum sp.]|nr:hypothetical protein [Candidatus ainarchaeum sp.]
KTILKRDGMTNEKERERLEELGFGTIENNKFILNEYEKRYCEEKGYLKTSLKFTGRESTYKVFKELREHGIICRFSKDSELVRIYQRGFRPGEDRTKYLMKIVDKNFPKKEEIFDLIVQSKKMRKELLFAIVEKKGIFYLKINQTSLF